MPLPMHSSQCCRDNSALFWQDVLPGNRQLLQLTQLGSTLPWRALDPSWLARSCSQLQQLSLCCAQSQLGFQELTALLQLTALSSVWLLDVADSDPVASVAQLSGLQGLERLGITAYPADPCSISDDVVASLTALTKLTHLALPGEDGVFSAAMQQQLQRCDKGPFTEGPLFLDMHWRGCPCFVINTVSALSWCLRQPA